MFLCENTLYRILNQLRVMSLDTAKSSSLNTAFVFNNFVCGAIGNAVSGIAWTQAGWTDICAVAMACIAVAAIGWLFSKFDVR